MLAERLRRTDAVARLGGDEFAVLLPHAGRGRGQARRARACSTACASATAQLDGQRRRAITMSLGIAMFDGATVDAQDIIVNADLAMYDAKEAGRDRLALYATDGAPHARSQARLTWVDRIDDALARRRLPAQAQPIRDLATGAVSQYELLMRMRGARR